jgi:phospholipase C
MTSVEKFRACSAVVLIGLISVFCGCQGLPSAVTNPPPPPPNNASINSINHIVFMAQENRSFDTYFGQLQAYWQANGYPQASQQPPFDGLPANASNPAYNGTTIPGPAKVNAFHLATDCIENLSPSWDESHEDWNLQFPTNSTAKMDGFVYTAASFATHSNANGANPPYSDTAGIRVMGYYDGTDLNYYYFMASNFATSDRWFSPAMDRTPINRMYLLAATSQGYAYPVGFNPPSDAAPLSVPTIFDALQKAGISWKVYVTDPGVTYLTMFAPYASGSLPANVVPASQFLTDAQAGTLPQVAMIEGGYSSGLDEHPDSSVQGGAQYVSSLINGLMNSPSWKDSVFILTYDEGGGLYDHVPPQPAINPDGIAPVDLLPTDICSSGGGANCDFNYTGFRVPLIVISPFTKKNYVSHTVADYTAILALIERRFGISPLTKRDAAQMDMTEFFDFQNIPWATPPTPPAQATGGTCNPQNLGYPGP